MVDNYAIPWPKMSLTLSGVFSFLFTLRLKLSFKIKRLQDCRDFWHIFCLNLKQNKINWSEFMSAMKDDNVLTTDEAAQYLKISKATLLSYIHQRKIKAKKVGRSWRVLQSEIYRFLKEEEGKS